MRIESSLALSFVLFLSAVVSVVAQSPSQPSSTKTWSLPHKVRVKNSGPRTYRVTTDYRTSNARGKVIYRQRVAGEYTRGLPGGEVVWRNVTETHAAGAAAPFPTPQKRAFMDGFRYREYPKNIMKPDFFKGFPATAVVERNLVWDTLMIDGFGRNYFDRLKLNEPYHAMSNDDVVMPGVGTFHSRDVILEWVGRSQRNGRLCALITYQAFFNPLEIANGGMTLKGRSDYWGEIWVALATRQIEYATLHEVVVGEMKLAGNDKPQVVNVFRSGVVEPVSAK